MSINDATEQAYINGYLQGIHDSELQLIFVKKERDALKIELAEKEAYIYELICHK